MAGLSPVALVNLLDYNSPQKQQGWIREDSHSVAIFLGRVRIKMPNEKEVGFGSAHQNIQPPFQMMLPKPQPGTGRLMLGG